MLMKLGYGFIQYVSFEHVVESKKEAYYRALMEGQKNRYNDRERIDRWTLFFLESLVELTRRLETKYDTYSRLKVVLNERQQRIMAYVKEKETAQVNELESSLGNYSRNTIKKDLAYLVGEGFLLKTGAGRGVRYHAKK